MTTNHRGNRDNQPGATRAAAAAKTPPLTLADGQSHFATHGAERIHYVTLGHGQKTFVLVHGWACNLRVWREQIAALAGDARLILIDLPGHGQSGQPHAEYSMNFFADAVLAVLRAAGVEQATFIGHSMGAAVICRVCAQAPEKVVALVSVDGLLKRPQGAPGQAELLLAQLQSPHYLAVATGLAASFFPVAGTEKLRDETVAEMLLTPHHVMAGAMAGLLDAKNPDWDLKRVAVPVIALNAKNSPWMAGYEDYVRTLSPQSACRQFENAGHFLMLEQPAAFNDALMERLREFNLFAK